MGISNIHVREKTERKAVISLIKCNVVKEPDMKNVTAVILAGGQSKRMGENKALLNFQGKTFIQTLATKLEEVFPVLISCNQGEQYESYHYEKAIDLYEEVGPIGGIYSSLRASKTPYIWVVPCDTPFVTEKLGEFLCSYISTEYEALIPVMRNGQIVPTVGIYHKTALPVLIEMIENNQYKLMDLLKKLRVRYVSMEYTAFDDEMLENINHWEQYEAIIKKNKKPVLIAVSGIKNSGKTTLITKLLPALIKRGYGVATIKHDGHDFTMDKEGTDTFRHMEAGAYGTAIFSENKYMVVKQEKVDESILKEHFNDADIILLEGFKYSEYQKIEVVRKEISQASICQRQTLLAIASDCIKEEKGIPVCDLENINGLCDIIEKHIKEVSE